MLTTSYGLRIWKADLSENVKSTIFLASFFRYLFLFRNLLWRYSIYALFVMCFVLQICCDTPTKNIEMRKMPAQNIKISKMLTTSYGKSSLKKRILRKM